MLTIVSYASKNSDRQQELRNGIETILGSGPYKLYFPEDEASAIASIADADILLTYRQRFVEKLFQAGRSLRWVHIGDAGVEGCLFPALLNSDVILTNSRGIHTEYMAEWALAALFSFTQVFTEAAAWRLDREWGTHKDRIVRRRQLLAGKRALIVGYGTIGSAIASKLRAVGVECEGVVTRLRSADIPLHTADSLPKIISNFDIVVIMVPITPLTEGLFTHDLLQTMKTGSVLLNLARGKVLDESALIQALQNGPLAFAALDVFSQEPLPADSPLFTIPNLLMTPHISGNFPDYTQAVHRLFLENLGLFLSGRPLVNIADKVRGY